jgi:hypothetical protein
MTRQLSISPPRTRAAGESREAGPLDWRQFILSLIVSLALLLALVVLPHPW